MVWHNFMTSYATYDLRLHTHTLYLPQSMLLARQLFLQIQFCFRGAISSSRAIPSTRPMERLGLHQTHNFMASQATYDFSNAYGLSTVSANAILFPRLSAACAQFRRPDLSRDWAHIEFTPTAVITRSLCLLHLVTFFHSLAF